VRTIFTCALTFVLCTASLASADVDKKTQRIWKAKCAACHGEDGKAATAQGEKLKVRDMTSADFWKGQSDVKLSKAINEGVKGMDGYGSKLPPDDIANLVSLIKTFKK
jgi:mono/diheme cytochrome c family protein